MSKHYRTPCGIFALVIGLFFTSAPSAQIPAAGKIHVFVSIMPQAYFAERVGGSALDIEVLVAPGQSPATFEPTPKQMAALSGADVYFRVGLPFEDRLLQRIAAINDRLLVIDTRKGIELRSMDEGGDETNAHEHNHHGRPDPHIWLDPRLVKIQARTMADGLIRLDSTQTAAIEKNLGEFHSDLEQIDSTIAEILAPLKGRKLFVFHPSYGYFAEAYGLEQVAVETGGKEPAARQLAELIDRAIKDSVRVIFVQPQFSRRSAETIARAINGAVVPLDPLARDYLDNLGRMARAIERALAGNGK